MGRRSETASSARPLVAGVLALLIILQGLAAIGSSVARSAHSGGETIVVVSLLGATCVADAQGDDHSPAPQRGHGQCCVLCGARDFDGAAFPGVARICDAIAPMRTPVSIDRHFVSAPNHSPIGWASSWSSQAPPIFS